MTLTLSHIAKTVQQIRPRNPLIHNITNYVVMDFTANVLLAIGASPAMVHSPKESAEMTALSDALVLNIGTLSKDWLEGMEKSLQLAQAIKKPVVLDPVAVGCTKFRKEAIDRLLQSQHITVIKGNASEILAIAQNANASKGPDALHDVTEATHAAIEIATQYHCVICVTGQKDFITDGKNSSWVLNGHPLLQTITGTGCAASTIVASFLTVEPNPLIATISAMVFYGVAAEIAAKKAAAPASFRMALIDSLYTLTEEDILSYGKFEVA